MAHALAEAKEAIDAASSRDHLRDVAAEHLPPGWVFDERGDAVPADDGRRDEWVPEVGAEVVVRQLGGATAEVVGLDAAAGEVVVKMGSITTRAPLAGVSPVHAREAGNAVKR